MAELLVKTKALTITATTKAKKATILPRPLEDEAGAETSSIKEKSFGIFGVGVI
jgi:hypothetical protein